MNSFTKAEVEAEIVETRKFIANHTTIPISDIVGYRSPLLECDPIDREVRARGGGGGGRAAGLGGERRAGLQCASILPWTLHARHGPRQRCATPPIDRSILPNTRRCCRSCPRTASSTTAA